MYEGWGAFGASQAKRVHEGCSNEGKGDGGGGAAEVEGDREAAAGTPVATAARGALVVTGAEDVRGAQDVARALGDAASARGDVAGGKDAAADERLKEGVKDTAGRGSAAGAGAQVVAAAEQVQAVAAQAVADAQTAAENDAGTGVHAVAAGAGATRARAGPEGQAATAGLGEMERKGRVVEASRDGGGWLCEPWYTVLTTTRISVLGISTLPVSSSAAATASLEFNVLVLAGPALNVAFELVVVPTP
ncbi:unnamed protein product [Closterium sp. NIES-65]|nr:unnamed protein product [Closterium sp. NIES-65]